MKKIEHKLEDFSFEKLEERKEFTFYHGCGDYSKHDDGCDKHHNDRDRCNSNDKYDKYDRDCDDDDTDDGGGIAT